MRPKSVIYIENEYIHYLNGYRTFAASSMLADIKQGRVSASEWFIIGLEDRIGDEDLESASLE
jgi:hypothetical protein